VIVVFVWAMSIVAATTYLINHLISLCFGYIFIPLWIITSIVSYSKIFLTLHHHQTQVQDHSIQQGQPSRAIPLNISGYRKAVSSVLWAQLALVACYLPFATVSVGLTNNYISSSDFLALGFAVTLVYFNSSLNPFLYCWKISEVRQAVKDTIREALYCLSN